MTKSLVRDFGFGFIGMWSGSLAAIPAGWALCNGENGTPDLQDKFIPGAGNAYNPDDSNGAQNNQHDFTGDGHKHHWSEGGSLLEDFANDGLCSTEPVVGTTDLEDTRPKYHSLAYIMEL